MKFRLPLFCFLLLTCVVAARAQDVNVDFDRGSNFSKFRTYSWVNGVPAKNLLVDQQIRSGIDAHLAAKGLQRVEQGGDLSVFYLAAVDRDVQVAKADWVATGNWLRPTESGISVRSQMWDIEVGTLVVCLSEASSKALLWRGTARTMLDSKSRNRDALEAMNEDAKKVGKRVRKSLEKMFKQYPAKSVRVT